MNNDEQFLSFLRANFPDIYIIMEVIQKGLLSTEEVAEVVHKLAIIRTSDDGFGKLLIEMQRKPEEGNWMRIRTMQDKVLRQFPEEQVFDK